MDEPATINEVIGDCVALVMVGCAMGYFVFQRLALSNISTVDEITKWMGDLDGRLKRVEDEG
jgi:hypothetical protein